MCKLALRLATGAAVGLTAIGWLGGCTHSAPTRFYILATLPPAGRECDGRAAPAASRTVLGLRPIIVPAYLDQPQIVVRTGVNQVRFLDFHHWAEPLPDGMAQVLAGNLAARLRGARVVRFPWPQSEAVDYAILVCIERFEGGPGGEVGLEADLTVQDARTGVSLVLERAIVSEQSVAGCAAALVAAQSRVLASLSERLAEMVEDLDRRCLPPAAP